MITVLGIRPDTAATSERSAAKAPALTTERMQQTLGAEQYRALRHIVEQFGKTQRSVIAISSPVAGDGKTMTSLNLAKAMAQSQDSRVLLIDADLRRGSVGELLGIARGSSLGLAGAIADRNCRLSTVVRRVPGTNLSVLPTGACPAMPYETLRSQRAGAIFKEAKDSYDYVLVDTPPVVPVADTRALSQWVDGFILVVSAHQTPRPLLDEALSAMDPEKVLGIVYNGDDLPASRKYRYYYSYGTPARPSLLASLLPDGARR
jgi:protein-tyrosine kinase